MPATHPQFSSERLERALGYIDAYWSRLERFGPHDEGTLLGVPRPYFVPSAEARGGFNFEEIYYWDTYFIAQGLIGTRREGAVMGLANNLISLQKRFNIIPNAGRSYFTGRSQPPLLTSLIFEVYQAEGNKHWLADALDAAKEEYRTVWLGTRHPNWRQVFHGLSRYYDVNVLHDLAEAESGWDMTTRFNRECLSYIPVDLNALLYKYERDFETGAMILGYLEEAREWAKRALKRKAMMRKYLWDEEKGFYFDYNYLTGKRSNVWSLAGFYPMWAGLDGPKTAARVVRQLDRFEYSGGLSATAAKPLVAMTLPAQWAYPNGWAPLHLIVCEALERYEYHREADRIARKWLRNNLERFEATGEFMEKYNVVDRADEPAPGVYPSQTGFGWTNGVFRRLAITYLRPDELPKNLQLRQGSLQRSLGALPALLPRFSLKLLKR